MTTLFLITSLFISSVVQLQNMETSDLSMKIIMCYASNTFILTDYYLLKIMSQSCINNNFLNNFILKDF